MKISEVRIKLAKDESDPRVKGYANITFEGLFVVHGIRILENDERVFIAMPSKKLPISPGPTSIERDSPEPVTVSKILSPSVSS